MAKRAVSGLILAGGRGLRMGGVDKGLQPLHGRPLVAHVIERLGPQVGTLLISANRNLEQYGAFGLPVLRDADDDFKGPLAGLLAGLAAAQSPWLVCAPCDVPHLPTDLVSRLAAARDNVSIVIPRDADGRLQPLCALLRCDLHDSLALALEGGQRRVLGWMQDQPHQILDIVGDFGNLNTVQDLRDLHD